MMWVRLGANGFPGDTYGAGGSSKTGAMPAFDLDDAQLAQITLYERVEFGGLEEDSEEYLALEAIANGETTFADAGLGELSAEAGVDEADLAGG
jgi:hypothetical protein